MTSLVPIRRLPLCCLLLLACFGGLLLPGMALGFNHPELKWRVYDTPHFKVYYYPGVEESAAMMAEMAEEIYPRMVERYDMELPLPIRIVINDTFDFINGAAYPALQMIHIEGVSATSEFRGVHDWHRDILVHEMAHLFSLRRTTMLGDLVPGIIVSGLDAPADRSFQAAASVFLPAELSPRWFAEGIAQFDSADFGYDRWDNRRDMLLRTAILEDGLFSFGEMAALSNKNYLGSEKVYNQGFGFLLHLEERFGSGTAAALAKETGGRLQWDFRKPMARTLGTDPEQVYQGWIEQRRTLYLDWLREWSDTLYEGEPVVQSGFMTNNPAISPDGAWLVYTGSGGSDFPAGDLYLRNMETGKEQVLMTGIGSQPAWMPDGSAVIVSSAAEMTWNGYLYHDLYRISVPEGKVTRLTDMARAEDPAISADGAWLAASTGRDGRRDITLWPLPTTAALDAMQDKDKLGEARTLTAFAAGVEARNPTFSPDGTRLVFQVNNGPTADLMMLRVTDAVLTPLTRGPTEDIDPFFLDNNTLAYISDERRAFDLYTLDLTDGTRQRWTTTVGGAFEPSRSTDWLYYSLYRDGGFTIYRRPLSPHGVTTVTPAPAIDHDGFAADVSRMTAPQTIPYTSRPYRFDALPVKVYPELLYADRSVRAGATVAFGDVLGKHSIEVEVLLGQNQDYHFSYRNQQLHPELFVDVSRYVRRDQILHGFGEQTKLDFTFDAAMAGMFLPVGSTHGFLLTESARRIDFGYPIDRTVQRSLEHALLWRHYNLTPHRRGDINPTGGRVASLRMANTGTTVFEIPFGGSLLDGQHERSRFWTWEGDYTEYLTLGRDTTLELGARLGMTSHPVTLYDKFYMGGRIFFLRQGEFQTDSSFPGYEDFAMSGEKLALLNMTYRFPLWQGHARFGPFTADSVYMNVFTNAGNVLAHEQPWKDFLGAGEVTCPPGLRRCALGEAMTEGMLLDAGAEVRVKTLLFDIYPWHSFFRVAYGFHEPTPSKRTRAYLGLGIGY